MGLSETKLKGKREMHIGRVYGRISGVKGGHRREGVAILLKEELVRWYK